MLLTCGHYYIEGVGYSTVQDILTGTLSALPVLCLLCLLKLLATCLTLGSGASGGIFSPALYMGATLGGAYGIVLDRLFPGFAISPPAFAVAGMAALVGGATGAAIAAIVMIFEMTLDYNVIIPITTAVVLSYGVRKALCRDSIYTLKLVRRGHYMPEAMQTNFHHLRQARDVMNTSVMTLPSASTLEDLARLAAAHRTMPYFVVVEGNRVVGVIGREAA